MTVARLSPSIGERHLLAAILVVYLIVGALYAVRVPPYNAPDEPAHANYARDVGERATLPVLQPGDWNADLLERLKSTHFPTGSDVSSIRYESHQPPLYYVALAPIARLTRGLGERPQLVALRLATLGVGALALVALFATARVVYPDDATLRLAAVGLAAFIPMHVAVGASVSNDAAAELFATLVLCLCLRGLRDGFDDRRAALLGLAVGLGLLTKLTNYVGLPLAILAVLATPADLGARLRRAALALAVAAVVVAPWLARGASLYGLADPFGLRRHELVVAGQPLSGPFDAAFALRWLTTLLHSFWGQFGWMGVLLDARIYLALGILTALIGIGIAYWLSPWGGFWRTLDARQRRSLALAALLVGGVAAGTVGYNLTYLQPQGRYLFPAMAGIALWAVGGLSSLIALRQRATLFGALVVGLIGLDVLALLRYVEPALRP